MEYFFLFIAVVILVLGFMIFSRLSLKFGSGKRENEIFRKQKTEDGKVDFVRCPLCNTPLAKNEDMFSRIYRPMNTPDQRMTVHGCPHCYPKLEAGVKRICPVCRKDVPMDGELIARLFNRTEGKKHVMITGCTVCYAKKK
ncbi:MAG: hypothetical protein KBT11_02365 [Treponema sp.]|nr:hypothetical protein [Candidatus Treponema equifaecale]